MEPDLRIRLVLFTSVCALFLAVGCGVGQNTSIVSQNARQTSTNYVFVENAQSGVGLHVLRQNADGTLQEISGSPFAIFAQHVGIAGQYLVAGGDTIAAYTFDPSGSVNKSSADVPGGEIAANAKFVYAGTVNAFNGYSVQGGQLVPVPGSPYGVVEDLCGCATPVYGTLNVTRDWLFYGVSAGHGGSSINAAHIGSDGTITSELIDGGGTAPSAGAYVAPNAGFVYESSSGLGTLWVFPFDPSTGKVGTGTDTKVASAVLVFDPSGTFAFTQLPSGVGIGSYRINQSGELALASSISAPNAVPNVVTPDGKYLLTLENPTSSTYAVGVYAVDANRGSLTKVSTYALPPYSSDWSPSRLVVGTF